MVSLFGKYMKSYPSEETEAYECKFTSNKSMPFDTVKEHQIEALLKVEYGGLYHRITDQPWQENRPYSYTLKKPFDCFCMNKAKGYLMFWFYIPRKPKKFIKVRVKDFLKLKNESKKKSFSENEIITVASGVLNI